VLSSRGKGRGELRKRGKLMGGEGEGEGKNEGGFYCLILLGWWKKRGKKEEEFLGKG